MAAKEERDEQDEQAYKDEMDAQRESIETFLNTDPIAQIEAVYQLWWRWADFELVVISPHLPQNSPSVLIPPERIPETNEVEFVYPILDSGYKFSTSKGEEMYASGLSLCKSHFTIEKIIYLLTERLAAGGVEPETEVLIAFGGHELLQRKAFESIINLTKNNLVVTNFDPGLWGEEYLQRVKRLVEKGYGYPPEAPRSPYRQTYSAIAGKNKQS